MYKDEIPQLVVDAYRGLDLPPGPWRGVSPSTS